MKSSVWLKLAIAVRAVLAIPATETSSEHGFSLVGRILEEWSMELNVEAVDGSLFIQGLRKLKK